jgi:hypothetical protein
MREWPVAGGVCSRTICARRKWGGSMIERLETLFKVLIIYPAMRFWPAVLFVVAVIIVIAYQE